MKTETSFSLICALLMLGILPTTSAPKLNSSPSLGLHIPPLFTNRFDFGYWRLQGNSGTVPDRDFLGTRDDQPLQLKAFGVRGLQLQGYPEQGFVTFIGGSPSNRVDYSGECATIGGGFLNRISVPSLIFNESEDDWDNVYVAATISGGYGNCITNDGTYGFIGGGASNLVSGAFCSVVGGLNNVAQDWISSVGGGLSNIASRGGTIGGGWRNIASAGTIGGGVNNQALGTLSIIGGGSGNSVLVDLGTVSGGRDNIASNYAATIGGGWANVAGETYSTVSGGALNQATGYVATVSGGNYNKAGAGATVGGGGVNHASGMSSTIPGGSYNDASGTGSFACGTSAKAVHDGAFVWADSLWTDPWHPIAFSSINSNEFAIRATGGTRFISAIDGWGNPAAGVSLSPGGGAWSTLSDRNAKEHFAPVDVDRLLDQVASLPISTWNYKSQAQAIRHIGPTAQDFDAAFHVGENDTHITTVDADGVALAAIQGLARRVEDQKQQLAAKEAELKAQKTKLRALEERLTELEKVLGQK